MAGWLAWFVGSFVRFTRSFLFFRSSYCLANVQHFFCVCKRVFSCVQLSSLSLFILVFLSFIYSPVHMLRRCVLRFSFDVNLYNFSSLPFVCHLRRRHLCRLYRHHRLPPMCVRRHYVMCIIHDFFFFTFRFPFSFAYHSLLAARTALVWKFSLVSPPSRRHNGASIPSLEIRPITNSNFHSIH